MSLKEKIAMLSALQYFLVDIFGQTTVSDEEYLAIRELFVEAFGDIEGEESDEFENVMTDMFTKLKYELVGDVK